MSVVHVGENRPDTDRPAPPVIRVTQYDQIWSTLVALLSVLIAAVWLLYLVWNNFQPHIVHHELPVEILPEETSGGVEGGSPTDSLKLEGTGPERADATPGEAGSPDVKPEVEQVLQSVALETPSADSANSVASGDTDSVQLDVAPVATAAGGHSEGTGTRPALGGGPGSKGGWPRHMRWYVHFPDQGSLPNYAKELDYFGIELGALLENHTMVYVSDLSGNKPTVRSAKSGEGEKRLFFTWQGGKRRDADVALFAKAGVNIGPDTIIFHFYPAATENTLALKERDFRKRPLREIRRTFFAVVPSTDGYDFQVTRQVFY